MAFGSFKECAEQLSLVKFGAISYLTYFLSKHNNEFRFDNDVVYAYVYDKGQEEYVEVPIKSVINDIATIKISVFNRYSATYDTYRLESTDVLTSETLQNIIDYLVDNDIE